MTALAALKSASIAFVLTLFFASSPVFAQIPAQKGAATAGDKRVLIISIDGLWPDVLLRAKTPNIRGLMDRGAFTMHEESTDVAVTLPSHVSMLTGVSPAKHGITWNDDRPVEATAIKVPTLFELVKRAGYSTALVTAKPKICILAKAGTVDWVKPPETIKDEASVIATRAVGVLRQHRPQVMFVHFNDLDTTGHARGWGSPEQLQATGAVDEAVGKLMAVLGELGIKQKTLVIVTADHGGSAKRHGANDPCSHHIPWIAVGPGVRENYDLTLESKLTIRIVDVFATALHFLGVAIPPDVEGKSVTAAFQTSAKVEPDRRRSLAPLPLPALHLARAPTSPCSAADFLSRQCIEVAL